EEVTAGFLSRMIQKTQERIENHFFEARKNVLEYDDVLNAQREHIYGLRREILLGRDVHEELVKYVHETIAQMVEDAWMLEGEEGEESRVYDHGVLYEDLNDLFPLVDYASIRDLEQHSPEGDLRDYVVGISEEAYRLKAKEAGDAMIEMERYAMLKAVNDRWMEHLQTIEYIREGIGLRGYGQVDPLVAYKRETYDTFQNTLRQIRLDAAKTVFRLRPQQQAPLIQNLSFNMDEIDQALPVEDTEERGLPMESATEVALGPRDLGTIDWKKISRNEPCPCGSGKKFKECHYKELREAGVI
ncbi:MAG: hypothetical protein EOP83_33725, partial [Verrucomicrobiaceae bacterium]